MKKNRIEADNNDEIKNPIYSDLEKIPRHLRIHTLYPYLNYGESGRLFEMSKRLMDVDKTKEFKEIYDKCEIETNFGNKCINEKDIKLVEQLSTISTTLPGGIGNLNSETYRIIDQKERNKCHQYCSPYVSETYNYKNIINFKTSVLNFNTRGVLYPRNIRYWEEDKIDFIEFKTADRMNVSFYDFDVIYNGRPFHVSRLTMSFDHYIGWKANFMMDSGLGMIFIKLENLEQLQELFHWYIQANPKKISLHIPIIIRPTIQEEAMREHISKLSADSAKLVEAFVIFEQSAPVHFLGNYQWWKYTYAFGDRYYIAKEFSANQPKQNSIPVDVHLLLKMEDLIG